jgi:hypothetical protein
VGRKEGSCRMNMKNESQNFTAMIPFKHWSKDRTGSGTGKVL